MSLGNIVGVILAGGQGRRMGGKHKAFLELGGRPLVDHALSRLKPQTEGLLISANQDREKLSHYGYPVIADIHEDAGPLAGVLAIMKYMCQEMPQIEWLITVAVDTPLFPLNYRKRMEQALIECATDMACASSHERMHPVFALWPVEHYEQLKQAVEIQGQRKLGQWIRQQKSVEVEFSGRKHDPFFNINTAHDLREAALYL